MDLAISLNGKILPEGLPILTILDLSSSVLFEFTQGVLQSVSWQTAWYLFRFFLQVIFTFGICLEWLEDYSFHSVIDSRELSQIKSFETSLRVLLIFQSLKHSHCHFTVSFSFDYFNNLHASLCVCLFLIVVWLCNFLFNSDCFTPFSKYLCFDVNLMSS